MLLEDLLRLIRPIERLSVSVFARSGVVAAHDEMRATVILADQCVPDGLAWTAHAHGQRQQGKFRSRLRELGEQQLVAAHTRVVIHIAGLRHAHHGMNQQVRLDLLGSAECQFDVGPMHGITRLERHYAAPALASKLRPNFGWSQT